MMKIYESTNDAGERCIVVEPDRPIFINLRNDVYCATIGTLDATHVVAFEVYGQTTTDALRELSGLKW